MGERLTCRTGHGGKCDLRILDSGPAGNTFSYSRETLSSWSGMPVRRNDALFIGYFADYLYLKWTDSILVGTIVPIGVSVKNQTRKFSQHLNSGKQLWSWV